MTPSQEGAYIRLLCYDWDKDGIPNDPDQLAKLSRVSVEEIRGVIECFITHPSKTGYLTNERLQEERLKQSDWRKKSSEGGKKGSAIRWNKKSYKLNKGGNELVNEWSQPKHDSSSTSSSASSSTPPTPSTNGNHSLILFESVRDTLSDLYKRPRTDPLSCLTQNSLAELCRRPNVNAELDLVVKYRKKIPEKDRQFFPQSFGRLIESWEDVVDRARAFKEPKAF